MNEDDICLLCKKLHSPVIVLHASPEESAAQWARETEHFTRALADVLRLTIGSVTRASVAELARDMASGGQPPAGSLLARCTRALEHANHDGPEYDRVRAFADVDPERVGLLAASVHGVLAGLEEVHEP